jgi:hypothetical protein
MFVHCIKGHLMSKFAPKFKADRILPPMIILITAGVPLSMAAVLWASRSFRRGLRLSWIFATVITGVTWLLVLLWQPLLPVSISLPAWKGGAPYMLPSAFSANGQTWPFALSIVGVVMAALLTTPAKDDFGNWRQWAFCLLGAGITLLAITAENGPALLALWAGLDMCEIYFMLRPGSHIQAKSSAGTVLYVRLAAIGVAMLGQTLGGSSTGPAYQQAFILTAVILRLSVTPLTFPQTGTSDIDANLGMTLLLCSTGASLAVLTRYSVEATSTVVGLALAIGLLTAALVCAWSWMQKSGPLQGAPYWILGLAALALIAYTRGNATGLAGWGSTLLLTSALLFFPGTRRPSARWALGVAMWAVAALPISPSATAWNPDPGSNLFFIVGMALAQGVLLAGLLPYAARRSVPESAGVLPVWRAVHALGIASLPIGLALLGVWGWEGALQVGFWPASVAVAALAGGLAVARRRWSFAPILSPQPPGTAAGTASSPARLLNSLDEGLHTLTQGVTALLQGEAGIMWSMLLLLLLVSLMAGIR